jgi:hypothetical protein
MISAYLAVSRAAFHGQIWHLRPVSEWLRASSTNSSTCRGFAKIFSEIDGAVATHGLQERSALIPAHSRENNALLSVAIGWIHIPACPIKSTKPTFAFPAGIRSLMERTVSTTILC